jgi:hypothetical protein
MPQFDFFIWFSLSLGTVLTFQLLYYFLLYYILAPFANLQKTLVKLYALKQSQESLQTSLFEQLVKLYFQKVKIKKDSTEVSAIKILSKKKSESLKPKLLLLKKKARVIVLKKSTKKNNLKKKDIILQSIGERLNLSYTPLKLIISKKKVTKKLLKKRLKLKLKKKKISQKKTKKIKK